MIQTDIDLLQNPPKDSYFFALRLLNLTKSKKKPLKHPKNSHFNFILQQDHYIIDQTRNPIENIFWMIKTNNISLNKEIMYFQVQDIKQANTLFDLKLYLISHQQVNQLALMQINSLVYVSVFLQCNKSLFRETVSLCPEFGLQYEVYISETELALKNLIKQSDEQVLGLRNAFKKKAHEIIEIENEKAEVKPKTSSHFANDILRKSLYVNMNKLKEAKKKNQQMKEKSLSKNSSQSSFISQLGDFFKTKPLNSNCPQLSQNNLLNQKKSILDSQTSFSKHPSLTHSSRLKMHNKDQKIHFLAECHPNLQTANSQDNPQMYTTYDEEKTPKHDTWRADLKFFKTIVILLIIAFVIFYFWNGGKKVKLKTFKNIWKNWSL